MLAGCSQSQANQSPASLDPATWLKQNAIQLKTSDPGGSDADLHLLPRVVGNASVIGLGDATFGTHETVTLDTRIVEYLVMHLQFTSLVLQNPWARSKVVDDYINGGTETPTDLMNKGELGDNWDTQEFTGLLQWMRTYNADPSHGAKLHIYGMDCNGESKGDFSAVVSYINAIDPSNGQNVQAMYARIEADQDFRSLPQYQAQAQQVVTLLQQHQQDYTARSSAEAFALALRNAQIIAQYITCANGGSTLADYVQRDAFMSDNTIWIHDHLAGADKLITWGWNVHVADNTTYYQNQVSSSGTANMGHLLHQHFGSGYLPIGISLLHGTFTAITGNVTPFHASTKTIPEEDLTSYNTTLGATGLPLYMVDLRAVPSGTVARWANGDHPLLSLGVDGTDTAMSGSLKQWFDVIIHLQNTTPTHIISNAIVTTS